MLKHEKISQNPFKNGWITFLRHALQIENHIVKLKEVIGF